MLQGAFPYHIDDKGRLKMPAEFVGPLGTSFTITRGIPKGCLWLLPQAEWEPMLDRLEGDSLLDQRLLTLQRWFIGAAAQVSLDGQGRLTIPQTHREMAGIQREVMLVGTRRRVELWSRERWDAYQNQLTDEMIEDFGRSAGI